MYLVIRITCLNGIHKQILCSRTVFSTLLAMPTCFLDHYNAHLRKAIYGSSIWLLYYLFWTNM